MLASLFPSSLMFSVTNRVFIFMVSNFACKWATAGVFYRKKASLWLMVLIQTKSYKQ